MSITTTTSQVATDDRTSGVRRLARLADAFLGFGSDPGANIERLVAALGELLGAELAYYSRLEDGRLRSRDAWHGGECIVQEDEPDGSLGYEPLRGGGSEQAVVIRDLQHSPFAASDPSVLRLGLRTFAGRPVQLGPSCLGSLCVVFREDVDLDAGDAAILGTIAAAIGAEEARRRGDREYRVLFDDSLRSLSLLEATLESTADGVLVVDTEGHVVCCNEKFLSLWEIPRELISSRDDARLLAHVTARLKDPAAFRRRVDELYRDPTAETFDRLEFEDGRVMERLSQPQRVHGAVVGRVWSFRDVTARSHAEDANRRLAAVVEQTGEFVVMIGPAGAIEYVNPAFERISGWSSGELLGTPFSVLAESPGAACALERLWGEACCGAPASGSFQLRRREASSLEVALTMSAVRDGAGHVANIVAIGRDVTAERRVEDQLRLSQKMEAVGQLAGGVAHDFNNLLTAIGGYAELALDHAGTHDAVHPLLVEISKAAGRASTLTTQLLALSRRQVLQPKNVDLALAIRAMEPMLRSVTGEQVEIETTIRPGAHVARVDPGQLEQVMLNLVVNARDAMPRGGRLALEVANVTADASLALEGLEPGDYVRLSVSDTGCGMDRETLARIFEPFFTTKERGKGTGLGLSSVYGIVSQSKGTITVESEPGAGTTFRIHVPRVTAPADAVDETVGGPVWCGSGTVLLVEDEEQVRTLVCAFLRRCGFNVLVAANPAEALAIDAEVTEPIDLLLTDVVMPGASGPELARAMAAHRPQMGVVFISGYEYHELTGNGELADGTYFLRKPFALDALGHTVRAAMGEALTGPVR